MQLSTSLWCNQWLERLTAALTSLCVLVNRQTDRRTDRVRRNIWPPPREEGRTSDDWFTAERGARRQWRNLIRWCLFRPHCAARPLSIILLHRTSCVASTWVAAALVGLQHVHDRVVCGPGDSCDSRQHWSSVIVWCQDNGWQIRKQAGMSGLHRTNTQIGYDNLYSPPKW